MTDFLLELLSEEIPARMQARARNDLGRMFAESMADAGLETGPIDVYSTPRRLALIARDVEEQTQAGREEIKGPRISAPPQALEGFLRKTGIAREQLEEREGVLFAVIDRPGRAAADVIADAVKGIVADFPWPKSMRWGDVALRWVRPLHGIVAVLGEQIVPIEIDGIISGATTVGHRFHHPGCITVGGAQDYVEKLRACHVIVDQDERERLIREGAEKAAAKAGLTLLDDEGLVVENAGLTEWPVPLLGRFEAEFLDVPREVIVLTMRTNQKYFACVDEKADLASAFVCVANVAAKDGGAAIAKGNARVLAARLADARFFWEQDRKTFLVEKLDALENVIFHEKLGKFSQKTYRIADLAMLIVEMGFLSGDPRKVRLTAELAKADLTTGMVGEFPELQGIVGGYLAQAEGEPPEVWEAIRDHYKPVGASDDVPTRPETIAISVADKIDDLCAFFSIKELPTGSKDPFALRRSALGLIRLIIENGIRIPLHWLASNSSAFVWSSVELERLDERDAQIRDSLRKMGLDNPDVKQILESALDQEDLRGSIEGSSESSRYYQAILETPQIVVNFIIDRLKVQQREAGVRHDLIDAVFALGGEDDLVRLLARVNALQSFVETPDGADLLTAYKRAANILKKENWTGPQVMSSPEEQGIPQTGEEDPLVLVEEPGLREAIAEMALGEAGAELPQERALIAALDTAEPKSAAAVAAEDFTGAMAALASLRKPIDDFFDHVTVNDPDPAKRERRLNLLMRFRDAVNAVADFSRIEG